MKKTLTIIILLLFAFKAFSELPDSTFKIKGHIAKLNNGTIFLAYVSNNGKLVSDSNRVVNGYFEFTGKISQPVAGYLQLTNTRKLDRTTQVIFLEPKGMVVELANEPFSTLSVNGSKTQDEYTEWKNANNKLKQKFAHVLQNEQPAENDVVRRKNYEDSLALYNDQKHMVEYDFFKSHPQSYVIPDFLMTHNRYYTVAQLKEIYNNLGQVVQASRNGKYLLEKIRQMAGISKDAIAANIISKDYINNKDFDLSSLKGSYVMIDFWGSWCQPCIKLLPDLVEEHKKYGSKNIQFVSVALDDSINKSKCEAIVNQLGMTWTNLWSSMDKKDANNITSVYDVGVFPTFILIDPSGKIIAREDSAYGYYKCRDLLESKLKSDAEQLTKNK